MLINCNEYNDFLVSIVMPSGELLRHEWVAYIFYTLGLPANACIINSYFRVYKFLNKYFDLFCFI